MGTGICYAHELPLSLVIAIISFYSINRCANPNTVGMTFYHVFTWDRKLRQVGINIFVIIY